MLEARQYQCAFCNEPLLFWFSSRCRNFGPSGSEFKYCLPETTFLSGSEADSREEFAGASLCAGPLSSTRFSVKLFNHSGRSRNGSPRSVWLSPFLFVFAVSVGFDDGSPHAWLLVISLRVDAGRHVEITASCGGDAGDVGVAELEEPVDRPGTTIGT